jgi:hypothetical protein
MLIRTRDGKMVEIIKNQYTNDYQYYIDLMKIKGYYIKPEPKDIISELTY